jgi:hypothetical protein
MFALFIVPLIIIIKLRSAHQSRVLLGFIFILLFSTIGPGESRVGEYWALRLTTVSVYIVYFIVTLLACRYKEEKY